MSQGKLKNPTRYWLGKKRSGETKEKISLKKRGNCDLTEDQKRHLSEINKGKTFSEETRRRISEAKKGKKRLDMVREKHFNWNGGTSFIPYTTDWTKTLKISIRERDKYLCRVCGEKQGDIAHAVHHKDYNKENCNPNNLITLCRSCHGKTNAHREYWIRYFKLINNE